MTPDDDPRRLVRISPIGEVLANVSLQSVHGFEAADIADFADDPNGTIYALAEKVAVSWPLRDENGRINGSGRSFEPGYWLVRFGKDGTFVAEARLRVAKEMTIFAVAVFANQNVFVIGLTKANKTFAGIFAPTGELLQEVSVPDDLKREETKGEYRALAADGLRLRVADDGNAYLITGRYFPELSVFSPDGSLVASHEIEIPKGVDDLWLEQFSQGKMVAELVSREALGTERVFGIFDGATGKMISEFSASIRDNWLVCYSADNDTLSFMPSSGSRIDLFRRATR